MQVISAREVAVFEGTVDSDDEALARVKTAPARRVLASAAKLHQRTRRLGNVPLRKDLKVKKLYASDTGSLERYMLATAASKSTRSTASRSTRPPPVTSTSTY